MYIHKGEAFHFQHSSWLVNCRSLDSDPETAHIPPMGFLLIMVAELYCFAQGHCTLVITQLLHAATLS